MPTMITETVELTIPEWVRDIDSFRRWTDEPDFPETGTIWWLCGKVWADKSQEQLYTHNGIKTELTRVLAAIAKTERIGRYHTDGVLVSNYAADISGNPDGLFISNETLASDRIRRIEGAEGGFVEVQGSPDMVLEVVSNSSVKKDLKTLRRAYFRGGIPEYWLIDARKDTIKFDILRRGARGYARTPQVGGWSTSAVFGRSFRLTRDAGVEPPDFTLEVR
jgi:Uma2 family endonuclease